MAVFLEASICWRSFDKPGHMVLTFQLASRRAGVFFILFDLPGVKLSVHLSSRCYQLQTHIEAGGPWRVSTLFAGGCPA